MTSSYPKTQEFLLDHGIAPSTILADTVTLDGYEKVTLDRDGKRLMTERGTVERTKAKWGEPGMAREVLRLMAEDERDNGASNNTHLGPNQVFLLKRKFELDRNQANERSWLLAESRLSVEEVAEYTAICDRVSETEGKEHD